MSGLRRGVLIAAVLALVIASVLVPGQLDLEPFFQRLESIPAWLLIAVVLSAPLLGIPLSALLVVVGATLPFAVGFGVVCGVLLAHHLLIHGISRTRLAASLRERLAERGVLPRRRARGRLSDDLLFILAATWVPGLSYVFKVALTTFAGMPFRTYLIAGVISQAIAALPYLILGKVAESSSFAWVGAGIFIVAVLAWGVRRLFFNGKRVAEA